MQKVFQGMRVATAQGVNYGIRDPRNLSPRLLLRTAIIFGDSLGSVVLTGRTNYPDLTWLRVQFRAWSCWALSSFPAATIFSVGSR